MKRQRLSVQRSAAVDSENSAYLLYRLDLGDGENRLDRSSLTELEGVLDEVAGASGPRALVTHGSGRYFCNGYDLGWLRVQPRAEQRSFIRCHQELLARWLLLPCPTVAALNGHAMGAGALFALAHDVRVMHETRGWFCLPEIDARIPFRPGMTALLQARLSDVALRHTVLTGARLAGAAAARLGVVHEVAAEGALLPRAVALAEARASHAGPVCGELKASMAKRVVEGLRGSSGA